MNKSSPLTYGGVLAFARGLPIVALLFASIRLESAEFGQVAVVVTAAATAALFADSGTDSAATWLLSRSGPSRRTPVIAALTYYRGLVAGSATAILVGSQIHVIDSNGFGQSAIVVLCCIGNMLSARNSSNRVLLRILATGEKRSILLEKAGIGLLFMIFTAVVPAEPGWVLLGYGVATVLGGLIASKALSREEWRTSWGDIKLLAATTLPFVATTACSALIWRLPTLFLGQTGQLEEAGYLALASYPIILVTSIPVLGAPLLLVKGGAHGAKPMSTVLKGAAAGVVCASLIAVSSFVAMMLPIEGFIASEVLSTILILSVATIPLWINPLLVATLRVKRGVWAPITANVTGAVVGTAALAPFTIAWHSEGAAAAIVLAESLVLTVLLIVVFVSRDKTLAHSQSDTRLSRRPMRLSQRSVLLTGGFGLVVCGLSAYWVLAMPTILVSVHLAVMLFLVTLTVTLEWRRGDQLPFLMSPGIAVVASIVVGSVAAFQFSDDDYNAYLELWILQAVGVVIGLALTQTGSAGSSVDHRIMAPSVLTRWSSALCLAGLLSAAAFFALYGVPALSGNVEQGRVDAAAEGTGYLRLVAYLMIPSCLLLIALRAKRSWLWFLLTLGVVLGLANRSPLVYLFVPLLFIGFSMGRVRLTSFRIVLAAVIVLGGVVGIGAFRIFSQDEFASYDEYRDDLAAGNYLGVAVTSLDHYSGVVADNAVLSKSLIDSGALEHQWGASYLTLFISALPGEQLSLDRLIKATTGKTFIGGGTPPTLMGEGYINFGPVGTIASAAFVIILVRRWGDRYSRNGGSGDSSDKNVVAAIYGYMVTWACMSQVAGLAGASTFPLAGALVFWLLWQVSQTSRRNQEESSHDQSDCMGSTAGR